MSTLLILNPKAAKGNAQKHFDRIFQNFKDAKFDHDVKFSEYPLHAESIANDAVTNGYDNIVVAGGDGTLNEVVNGILKSNGDSQLGIIPTGTCNDFIKAAGIPADIQGSCDTIVSGNSRVFDVGMAGDRYFINAVGIGFDVAVVQALQKSKHLNSFFIYLSIVLKKIFRYKGIELFIRNGKDQSCRHALMLTIANGICYGGNFNIAPHADPADGFLDAILINNVSPFKRLKILSKVFSGKHIKSPDVHVFKTNDLRIKSNDNFLLQIEGELMTWPSKEIHVKLLPKRLKITVPVSRSLGLQT
ncbi:MAG: diacylglycerol kinase family lipid kinase [Calditrichaeota bacterium]|nr:diacylglycerol kinase family lipid kinase [Calditrichota bacterium]